MYSLRECALIACLMVGVLGPMRCLHSQEANETDKTYWKTLLSDAADHKATPEQSAALAASLYVRSESMFDQRRLFLVELSNADKFKKEGLPLAISHEDLPANWQKTLAALQQTPVPEASKIVVDVNWKKIQDRGLLAQRLIRSSTLVQSQHFFIEADVPEAIIPQLVFECELTCALLEKYFDLKASTPTMWIRVAKNREAYLRLLKRDVQQIGLTSGYYDMASNAVFCYVDAKNPSNESLRHELTHLILVNHLGVDAAIDWNRQSDFWAFEAIATYFESMILRAGVDELCCMVGGWESPRLQPARYRRLHDLSWVPFEELRTMSRDEFQATKDIQSRYSQSAGLAHYFIDSSQETRNKFLKYVVSVHKGEADPAALAIESDENLRGAYDTFLLSDRESFSRYPLHPERRSIVLSHTDVESNDLKAWPASHRRLDWLDLSFTKTDGSWIAGDDVWQVKRWNLESTDINDDDLANIVRSTSLNELDLSNCKITDASASKISKLVALKTLYLTGTQVTDESLKELDVLKQLETLDIQKTSVTQEGWRAFLKNHPKVRKQK